jgi:rhodanese-related sulfurtransferase
MAAARALQAGYKGVRVMIAGILGWNAANKKVI